MKLSNFIEGLKTLQPYFDNDKHNIGAEHNQFYVYRTDLPLTPEDVEIMIKFDWFQPDGGIDEDGGEYNPEKAWSVFT